MGRDNVQKLIKGIADANKVMDKPDIVEEPEQPKELAPLNIKSAPPVKVESFPVIEVKGLSKQLEALKRKPHKTDPKKLKVRQQTVEALTKIAAELHAKEALDIKPVTDLLAEIAKAKPLNPDYKFKVNRDRNGFITTVDAKVVN